jgi:branched-chain amino acid aminotransferase
VRHVSHLQRFFYADIQHPYQRIDKAGGLGLARQRFKLTSPLLCSKLGRMEERVAQEFSNQRIAWFNGRFVPEGQVMIPFRDRSWKYGDGAFDMTRTFEGRPFRLKDHIDRFYRSLRYLQIDPGIGPGEMIAHSEAVVARNEHLRPPIGDWWLGQRVSRGVDAVGDEGWEHTGPNVVIEVLPLPLAARAPMFKDGALVVTTTSRRVAPSMLSPRAKTHNYLNMIVAEQPVKALNPDAWALLLDENGNLAEGLGSNIFIVKDGGLLTPSERYVLPGVSRQMTIDMAKHLGIACKEADIDLYDAANAEEMFLTSTSLCILPVKRFNGAPVADGAVPGPITKQLIDAYAKSVGCDFVAQYLAFLR